MTREQKDILLKYLCARLPYGVKLYWENCNYGDKVKNLVSIDEFGMVNDEFPIEECKPYLRPLSSMTEEERAECDKSYFHGNIVDDIDWLNAHHFDYRRLIDKGLAIEVTEDNNPYKD